MMFKAKISVTMMALSFSLAACQQNVDFAPTLAKVSEGASSSEGGSQGSSGSGGSTVVEVPGSNDNITDGSNNDSSAGGGNAGTDSGSDSSEPVVVNPNPQPTAEPTPIASPSPEPTPIASPSPQPTNPPAPVGVDASEVFAQSQSETKKLDILWVVDNSGSMSDEQASLARNFDIFINDFITKNVDFKMSITTTDTSSTTKCGQSVSGSEAKLNSAAAQANPDQFKSDFRSMIQVGINGSGLESGLKGMECWMSKHPSFLRPDAYFAVVLISDENDQSPSASSYYSNLLLNSKSSAGLSKAYSIVNTNLAPQEGLTVGFDRYKAVSDATAGTVSSISADFYSTLSDMGQTIINLLDSFALAAQPLPGTLKVFVNGVESFDYTYDEASRSIKFNSGSIPAAGSEIKVTYKK